MPPSHANCVGLEYTELESQSELSQAPGDGGGDGCRLLPQKEINNHESKGVQSKAKELPSQMLLGSGRRLAQCAGRRPGILRGQP